MTKRTKKSKRPAWFGKTTTASDIVSIIRDSLDADQEIEPPILRMVAESMSQAFDFTDEEKEHNPEADQSSSPSSSPS